MMKKIYVIEKQLRPSICDMIGKLQPQIDEKYYRPHCVPVYVFIIG